MTVLSGNGRTRKTRRDKEPAVRLGVVGCGYWGPQLIRNFDSLPGVELVAVADKRSSRREYVRRQYPQVRVFEDHAEMFEAGIDAVVIATPIHTHYEIGMAALEAGKHILVEKPLTARVEEAEALVRAGEQRRRVVMVGHTFLYNPAVMELRRLVDTGDLGNLYYVDAARLNLGLFQKDINVIWDLAPHDISILLWVLGRRPTEVSARGSSCVQPGVHDVAYIELRFEDGLMCQIHVSWLDPSKVRRITMVGDRKMVVYNDAALNEKIRIYNKGVTAPPATDTFGEFQLSYRYGEIMIPHLQWQEPLSLECQHFIECIRDGVRPRSDGMQGLDVVRVLEAADASLHDGSRRVAVGTSGRNDHAGTLRARQLVSVLSRGEPAGGNGLATEMGAGADSVAGGGRRTRRRSTS